MSYEIALQTSGPYDVLLANATCAEANGLVALAVPDHYVLAMGDPSSVPAYDALAQLAALARETASIELSVLVSPITFRHPAVLAKTALTIDHLSGGRFTLGIGTGWLEREHELFGFDFPDLAQRFEILEESLAYVRALLAAEPPGFSGRHFSLEATKTAPEPLGLRMVVGGVGPHKTPRLAGAYADEYNCYPAAPDEFAARVTRARKAAAASGRDPEDLLISSSGAILAAPTQSAYETLRNRTAAEAGMTLDQLDAHMERRATPRGTYADVAEQLEGLAAAGMQRFYLQRGPDLDQEADLALIEHLRS